MLHVPGFFDFFWDRLVGCVLCISMLVPCIGMQPSLQKLQGQQIGDMFHSVNSTSSCNVYLVGGAFFLGGCDAPVQRVPESPTATSW